MQPKTCCPRTATEKPDETPVMVETRVLEVLPEEVLLEEVLSGTNRRVRLSACFVRLLAEIR
jgi:hypothetical protein